MFLTLQFKGDDVLKLMSKRLDVALRRTYTATKSVLLNQTNSLLLPAIKTSSSGLESSHCIYKFSCSCQETYIGRTDRRLETRVNEHIPKWLCSSTKRRDSVPASSIGKHLLETGHRVQISSSFTVIARCDPFPCLNILNHYL